MRTCLPAGFGSGWDNFRGTPGHINISRPSVAGDQRDRDNRKRQVLTALSRQPSEPCRLPNEIYYGIGSEGQNNALKGTSASVTAFSPNGLLLAVAVEESPNQWSVKVCAAIGLCQYRSNTN